jgi:hypothetical protein
LTGRDCQPNAEPPQGIAAERVRSVLAARRPWVVGLLILEIFNVVSAVGGGLALVVSSGLGMPPAILERSPFDSFTGPGIILAAVVGGTQAMALVLTLLDHRLALAAAAVAASGMIVWIYVEVSMLLFYHWLQTVYFLAGATQLVIVLVLLGVLRTGPASSTGFGYEPNINAWKLGGRGGFGLHRMRAQEPERPFGPRIGA